MSDNMHSIIDSIELRIEHEFDKNPVCIYVGIGTFAGMTQIDRNGIPFLSDENYHQFPLALQELYQKNQDMQFFCIYIDPALEKPVFITHDFYLKQKLFENQNWKCTDDEFYYDNKRISVYPFRHSIKIKNTKREIEHDFIDITQHIERIHDMCISQNLLYIFHDFTGNDNIKYIEDYFAPKINKHLDHIIYGFGNGYITGCYHNMCQPESMFAYMRMREQNQNRDCIRMFSLQKVINMYNELDNQNKHDITFVQYMNDVIDMFSPEFIDIIMSQIKLYIDTFMIEFKNCTMCMLRYFYDISDDIRNGKEVNIQCYYIDLLGIDAKTKIISLAKTVDLYFFEKVKEIIGEKYKIQLELIGTRQNMNYIQVMNIITSHPNKYEWCEHLNRLLS